MRTKFLTAIRNEYILAITRNLRRFFSARLINLNSNITSERRQSNNLRNDLLNERNQNVSLNNEIFLLNNQLMKDYIKQK